MKKFFIFAAILSSFALATNSCGGGDKTEVNSDTVVSKQLADSVSVSLGAFLGANSQNELTGIGNVDDYIEGFQLVAGHKYSIDKLRGIEKGLMIAKQFANMESQGVEVNRDLFLQQFRRYINNSELNQAEYGVLYNDFQNVMQRVENILQKREMMRNGKMAVPQAAPTVENAETVTETEVQTPSETVETTEAVEETEVTDVPTNKTPSEREVVQAAL